MAAYLAPLSSISKLALPSLTRAVSNAAIRNLTASPEKSLEQERYRAENEEKPAGNPVASKKGENPGGDQEDLINRETGEIGGPGTYTLW